MSERESGHRYYEQSIALPAEIAERLLPPPTLAEQIQSLSPELQEHYAALESERDKYRREARVDLLTDLPNRLALGEWTGPMIESLQRQSERKEERHEVATSLELGILDLDHFKQVNDLAGHDTGDKVLAWFGAEIKQFVRESDMVARVGGEEFVVAFNGAGMDMAAKRLDELRCHISEASRPKLAEWGISDREALTVSGGLAGFDSSCQNYDGLFLKADAALYAAKSERNQVVSFNPNDPGMAAKVRGG